MHVAHSTHIWCGFAFDLYINSETLDFFSLLFFLFFIQYDSVHTILVSCTHLVAPLEYVAYDRLTASIVQNLRSPENVVCASFSDITFTQ